MSSPLSPLSSAAVAEITSRSGVPARVDLRGAALSTVAIGGPVHALFEPQSVEELSRLVAALTALELPRLVLGLGSNVLIPDAGIPLPVIRLGRGLRFYDRPAEDEVVAGGAMPLMALSRALAESGLSGLEFAGGIPGAIGGGVRMNAGAHGGEMSDRLRAVQIVLPDGAVEWIAAAELQFAYRRAALPEGAVVAAVRLALTTSSPAAVSATLQHFLAERKARQPLASPSLGSVFVNPSKELAAGRLIEELGLKGTTRGGAVISALHGNWILNPDRSATAEDFLALVALCERRALEERGVVLHREFKVL